MLCGFMKTAPNKIYLVTGCEDMDYELSEIEEEICWADHRTEKGDIGPYVKLDWFLSDVNRMAENRMLKTGVLEGAHYNAMKSLAKYT